MNLGDGDDTVDGILLSLWTNKVFNILIGDDEAAILVKIMFSVLFVMDKDQQSVGEDYVAAKGAGVYDDDTITYLIELEIEDKEDKQEGNTRVVMAFCGKLSKAHIVLIFILKYVYIFQLNYSQRCVFQFKTGIFTLKFNFKFNDNLQVVQSV